MVHKLVTCYRFEDIPNSSYCCTAIAQVKPKYLSVLAMPNYVARHVVITIEGRHSTEYSVTSVERVE